ncbi:MAG: hypothetical protein HRU41_27465 [Saprospiraceae bacterium]|nr:hypothetical protein [Saprospiraceae bacterium]
MQQQQQRQQQAIIDSIQLFEENAILSALRHFICASKNESPFGHFRKGFRVC